MYSVTYRFVSISLSFDFQETKPWVLRERLYAGQIIEGLISN